MKKLTVNNIKLTWCSVPRTLRRNPCRSCQLLLKPNDLRVQLKGNPRTLYLISVDDLVTRPCQSHLGAMINAFKDIPAASCVCVL
jgi:hypothetical protein